MRHRLGPSVSLLLPNMNNGPVLDEFFQALADNTAHEDIEIVCVDDGSTDDSVSILRRWRSEGPWPRFTLIEQENAGVPAAFNRCLENASGDVLVRLDGDATVETYGWLDRMLELLAVDERVGVVVSKIIFDNGDVHGFGRSVIDADGLRDRGTRILEPRSERTLDSIVLRPTEEESEGGDEIAEVDCALGCCTAFRREVADAVGGIDPTFSPVWVEDDDYTLAARREGWKVFYLPDVRVIHRISKRNPRHGATARPLKRAIELGGRILPHALKRPFIPKLAASREPPWRVELLRKHYAAWERKWGFDPVNPDLDAILARWGGSEVCWAYDDGMRTAGESIARRYLEGRRAAAPGESTRR
jgi:GT2 family glycosyltransferase